MTTASTPSPAGALRSTDRDLLRFVTALAGGTLLSPASRAAMQAFVPAEDLSQFGIVHGCGLGLGLERYELDAITVDGHMGTGDAQSAYVGYDIDTGTSVAVMTNTATPGPQAIMAVEALSLLRGLRPRSPSPSGSLAVARPASPCVAITPHVLNLQAG